MNIVTKYTVLFTVSFLIFTGLLFVGKTVYDFTMYDEEAYIEDTFIEPELKIPMEKQQEFVVDTEVTINKPENDTPVIDFHYLPQSYGTAEKVKLYTLLLSTFYFSESIYSQLGELHTYFYAERAGTRGRMKNKRIYMYNPTSLPREEFLAVCIHEFGHFLDLYILKKELYYDISNRFYNISWGSAKKLQP